MNLKAIFFYFWLRLVTSRHSGILSIHGVAYTYLYVTNYVELINNNQRTETHR
jgi:hypothetical protein